MHRDLSSSLTTSTPITSSSSSLTTSTSITSSSSLLTTSTLSPSPSKTISQLHLSHMEKLKKDNAISIEKLKKKIKNKEKEINELPIGRHVIHLKHTMQIECRYLRNQLMQMQSNEKIYDSYDVVNKIKQHINSSIKNVDLTADTTTDTTSDTTADATAEVATDTAIEPETDATIEVADDAVFKASNKQTNKRKIGTCGSKANTTCNMQNSKMTKLQLASIRPQRKRRRGYLRVTQQDDHSQTCLEILQTNLFNNKVPALINSTTTCTKCNGNLLLNSTSKLLVCQSCHREESSNHMFKVETTNTSSGYKRESYFKELLRAEQGTLCPVSKTNLDKIKNYLFKRNESINVITVDKACKSKELKLNKIAKFRSGIVHYLTGKRSPLNYTPRQLHQMIEVFHPINLAFERLKNTRIIKSRMNFPYTLVHFNILRLMPWCKPVQLKCFRLPDTKPLQEQTQIWNACLDDCMQRGIIILKKQINQ